ncbi:inosine/xanthosine triphosphatase [Candidatus Bathyarchaeota archaeon]|nr:MAG: inosine/xanthosine triphosphatase [Candidatus Bathyarchaeota archaeon]
MRVAVGSTNPVKIEAVKTCFNNFLDSVSIEAVEVETKPQPIGIDETIRGAVKRGLEALKKTGADLGVGIEAGLIKLEHTITGYINQHMCAIIDKQGHITIGLSMGFEFPPKVVEKILSGEAKEAEEAMEEISGIKEIGNKTGAIGYLTKEKITRKDLCIQAIISALIPRINPQLYQDKRPKFMK